MLFEVEPASASGRLTVRLHGELDFAAAPTLAEHIEPQLSTGVRSLVLDLTGTTFLDSSGARELALLTRRMAGSGVALHVVCPKDNRPVRLVIELLELDALVPLVESAGLIEDDVGP